MDAADIESGHLTRIHDSLLASRERKLLTSIAARLPKQITPDHLTSLGVAGGAITALGCIGAHWHVQWLFVAVAGLFINWFGDSLDGSVARFRGIERPRYGFFVDQFSDVTAHFLMLFGLGLSPLMRFDTALLALLGSLAIMFYGHLKLQFARSWQVSHYGVGPTELRIVIASGLVLAAVVGLPVVNTPVGVLSLFDVVASLVFVAAVGCILTMFWDDRAKLAVIDPPRGGVPPEVIMTTLESGGQRS